MSISTVPRQADLRKLAASGASIKGSIALAELARLQGVLAEPDGMVEVELRFGVDDEGYRCIDGTIQAAPRLQCQRCLEVVPIAIGAKVGLALVWREDEIPSLPSRFEGVVVGVEPTDLYDLIEEELLLALPLVPRHGGGECEVAHHGSKDEHRVAEEPPGNAFAAALRGSN